MKYSQNEKFLKLLCTLGPLHYSWYYDGETLSKKTGLFWDNNRGIISPTKTGKQWANRQLANLHVDIKEWVFENSQMRYMYNFFRGTDLQNNLVLLPFLKRFPKLVDYYRANSNSPERSTDVDRLYVGFKQIYWDFVKDKKPQDVKFTNLELFKFLRRKT